MTNPKWLGLRRRAMPFVAMATILLTTVFTPAAKASQPLPQVKLSVKPLDLSQPPTTEEIMAAGQLGGQLYPTHEMADAQMEQAVNASFGAAMQEWNRHEYKKAVKLLRKHMKEYPDSPWAAEAVLHIGCDAQYTGRYSEAETSFFSILEKLKGNEYEGARKLVHKATLRLAVLKVAENNFDEAGNLFSELHRSSDNWRDRTYASHWIQRLSRYKADKLAMLNCGSLALARVLEKEGLKKEAREVAAMRPARLTGYSMQDLMDIAVGYGFEFVGLHVAAEELAKLRLPAIVQLSARDGGDSGHYWVLERCGRARSSCSTRRRGAGSTSPWPSSPGSGTAPCWHCRPTERRPASARGCRGSKRRRATAAAAGCRGRRMTWAILVKTPAQEVLPAVPTAPRPGR